MNFTPADPIRKILRLRPLAVEILEKEFGHACWLNPDDTLSAVSESHGKEASRLAGRLSALSPLPPGTDWSGKPVCYLIDHLTRNHRDFRESDIPLIEGMLVTEGLPVYPDRYAVKLIVQEFNYFREDFLRHIEEEETFLYPKIMRNEACFRHKELKPEAHKGSVNLYLNLETHKPEIELKRMLTSLQEKLRNQVLHQPAAEITAKTLSALESFADRLFAHADLETDVLFPMAAVLEKELYESVIPGFSRLIGDN
ncbi:MAG: ric [Fibrobacteres bacterium]|nr:ric [Fibrobacterota bacterium]